MDIVGCNLTERLHDEEAFGHERMWNDEGVIVHREAVVKQDVDVDEAVVVFAADGFGGASQIALYELRLAEQLERSHRRLYGDGGIEEVVVRRESPRRVDMKSGLGDDGPNPFFDMLQCLVQVVALVAEIRSQTQIGGMHGFISR